MEDRHDALTASLARIDQLFAETEELLFSLDDDAWRQAENELEGLRELQRSVEWELSTS